MKISDLLFLCFLACMTGVFVWAGAYGMSIFCFSFMVVIIGYDTCELIRRSHD